MGLTVNNFLNVRIDNQIIPDVEQFCYLGSKVEKMDEVMRTSKVV